MTPVVALMVWTYTALLAGWWVGVHWRCESRCGRSCPDVRKARR